MFTDEELLFMYKELYSVKEIAQDGVSFSGEDTELKKWNKNRIKALEPILTKLEAKFGKEVIFQE